MNGYESSRCTHGADRRIEIVSGKGYGIGVNNQRYVTRPVSPNLPQVSRTNQSGWSSSSSMSKPWGFNDSESKRRKRIAKYKVYAVEGKVKDSLRKGLRWIKNKCSQIVHGY